MIKNQVLFFLEIKLQVLRHLCISWFKSSGVSVSILISLWSSSFILFIKFSMNLSSTRTCFIFLNSFNSRLFIWLYPIPISWSFIIRKNYHLHKRIVRFLFIYFLDGWRYVGSSKNFLYWLVIVNHMTTEQPSSLSKK